MSNNNNDADNMQQAFNAAIDFAIITDSPREFLILWREGDWQSLKEEWPEFTLPKIANI